MPQKQETQGCQRSLSNPECVPGIANAVPGAKSACQTPSYRLDSPCLPLQPTQSPCPSGPLLGPKVPEDELQCDGGLSGRWCRDNRQIQVLAGQPFVLPPQPHGGTLLSGNWDTDPELAISTPSASRLSWALPVENTLLGA